MSPRKSAAAIAIALGVAGSAAGVPTAGPSTARASAATFRFVGKPVLLLPSSKATGYNFVFRLNRAIPRRAEGSFDALTRTSVGVDGTFETVDKQHFCYFGSAPGRARHAGGQVTVKLQLGDGRDPVGDVTPVQTLTTRVRSRNGTGGPTVNGIPAAIRGAVAAAQKLGCTKIAVRTM